MLKVQNGWNSSIVIHNHRFPGAQDPPKWSMVKESIHKTLMNGAKNAIDWHLGDYLIKFVLLAFYFCWFMSIGIAIFTCVQKINGGNNTIKLILIIEV